MPLCPPPNLTCKLITETLQPKTVGVKGGGLHNDKVKSQKVTQNPRKNVPNSYESWRQYWEWNMLAGKQFWSVLKNITVEEL